MNMLEKNYQQKNKNKIIKWGEEQKPNSQIPYNHIIGECSIATFTIEWKEWKSNPTYSVISDDLKFDYLAFSIEEGKEKAEEYIERIIEKLLIQHNI